MTEDDIKLYLLEHYLSDAFYKQANDEAHWKEANLIREMKVRFPTMYYYHLLDALDTLEAGPRSSEDDQKAYKRLCDLYPEEVELRKDKRFKSSFFHGRKGFDYAFSLLRA